MNQQHQARMKVMKGSWFELRTKKEHLLETMDKQAFQEYVTDQVSRCKHLLDDINSPHRQLTVSKIDINISDDMFQRMIQVNELEKMQPIITFHGTTATAMEKILQEGYKAPGVNGGTRAHGDIYGPGVYSSHFLSKAAAYGTNTLLINIIFLGKVKLLNTRLNGSPVNGTYPDGTNTRVVFGLDQVISGDPNRVFPIGLVSVTI